MATYEDILGSSIVRELASIYKSSEETLDIAKSHVLKDYCEKSSFNKEQYDSFKAGVASILLVMAKCLEEVELAESPTEDK